RRYGEEYTSVLLWHIFLVGAIHAAIMLAAFLLADFRAWLYQYVWLNEVGERFVAYNFRAPGLTSGGGPKLSRFQAFSMLAGVAVAFAHPSRSSRIRNTAVLLCAPMMLGAVMLSGRTGLLVLLVGSWLWLLWSLARFLAGAPLRIRTLAFLSATLIMFGVVAYWIGNLSLFERVIRRAFEFYFVYRETGELGTESTDVILGRMYFLPNGLNALLFGTSRSE